jgi:hypothetical protein
MFDEMQQVDGFVAVDEAGGEQRAQLRRRVRAAGPQRRELHVRIEAAGHGQKSRSA